MNIELVGYKVGSVLTSLAGGVDTQAREGDLVIVLVHEDNSSSSNYDYTAPAGWIELYDLYAAGTYSTNLACFYKVMGATPDSSVTITGVQDKQINVVFRNTDFKANYATSSGTSLTYNIDPPAVVPNVPGSWVLIHFGDNESSSNPFQPSTWPTGTDTKIALSSGQGISGFCLYRSWSSGTYDPSVIVTDSQARTWIAASIVIDAKMISNSLFFGSNF